MVYVVHGKDTAWRWQGDKIAEAIAETLIGLGVEAVVSDTYPTLPKIQSTVILVDPESSSWFQERWAGGIFVYNMSEAYLIEGRRDWLRTFRKFLSNALTMLRIAGVFDYSPNNAEYFKSKGIPCYYTPLGYHPVFVEENICELADVGFLGKIHRGSRRERMLSSISPPASANAYCYEQDGQGFRKFQPSEINNWKALQSKCWLHLHTQEDGRNFPASRVIQLGLSNRKCCVVEKCDWYPEGLEPGKHFVEFEVGNAESLKEIVTELSLNDMKRRTIAEQGFRWVRDHYHFSDFIAKSWNESRPE